MPPAIKFLAFGQGPCNYGHVPYNGVPMKPDDKICYCYDVSYRKLLSFARREKPKRASQLSQCLGAGTGCGWCIPFLKKIFDAGSTEFSDAPIDLAPDEYAQARQTYIQTKQQKNIF